MYFGRPLRRCLLPACVLLTLLGTASRPGAAKDTWIEARSPHFTVISNAGATEARRIADQFEQFREVLHSAFPTLRLDLGCPLIIFGVKSEDSLKSLLPGYWEVQGRAHPAGIYVSGEERHFVALRTNTEGALPYEIVYHEYAHAILNLNFRYLPVWLSEGLAEYFGNSRIRDKEVDIGVPSSYRLETLRRNRMIPMEDLLSADRTSPYYNEQNRVSVFYAESWAMVHYLLLDPEARNQRLLTNFIRAWEASGDQVGAARETFGDLKKFSQTMEAYARKQHFTVATVKTAVRGDPKSFLTREIPPAEVSAYRALFYIHTKRPVEAEAAVHEALQQNPQLSVAYETQGLAAYTQSQFAAAGKSFAHAVALGDASFSAYYFEAMSELRAGVETEADQEHVMANLEKAMAMNSLFAPAFANLASLYSMRPETSGKAIRLAGKAVELDPENLHYAINFAYVLLNAGKVDEAKELAVRVRRSAWIPADQASADQLFRTLTDYEEQSRQAAQRARLAEEAQATKNTSAVAGTAPASATAPPRPADRTPPSVPPKDRRSQYMVEGLIADAECNSNSLGRVTLSVNHSTMRFVYSSLARLNLVEGLTEDTGHAPACANWKGRRARLFFYQTKDKPYAGELETIQFF